MQHLVLGTAGHIDHGKSALVEALSGRHPDRLEEERRRGITIELGFADLRLDDGRVISFVDVPGHERFVRHMVAGATGIDAVLLVVAADQGVQPQTREHLEICKLLGIPRGVVALTKSDLVDEDLLQVAELEVREFLEDSFLQHAALVPVSAKSGAGMDTLRASLAELFEDAGTRSAQGVPRLPIDRSFVMRGFGTVVTGTLISGTLEAGQDVEVLPGGQRGRIRGIQVHGSGVDRAPSGRRTAVNIQGLDVDQVPRGSTVTVPNRLATTRRVWASLRLLPDAPERLRRGGPARFHQGTSERAVRVRVLDDANPERLYVELHLDEEAVLTPGDRYILRRPAPVDTVGGGEILDVAPPQARQFDRDRVAAEADDEGRRFAGRVSRTCEQGITVDDLAREFGWTREQVDSVGAEGDAAGLLVFRAGRWLAADFWKRTAAAAIEETKTFHTREPLDHGIGREELRTRVAARLPQELWRALLEETAADERLRVQGDRVSHPDHRLELSADDRELSEGIARAYREAGLEPPDLEQVVEAAELARARKLVDLLLGEGSLVRIEGGRLFDGAALEELRGKLAAHAGHSPTIDVAAFKALAGITRKNAIPLLEQFDQERVTRRVGNQREILIRPRE